MSCRNIYPCFIFQLSPPPPPPSRLSPQTCWSHRHLTFQTLLPPWRRGALRGGQKRHPRDSSRDVSQRGSSGGHDLWTPDESQQRSEQHGGQSGPLPPPRGVLPPAGGQKLGLGGPEYGRTPPHSNPATERGSSVSVRVL